MWCLTKNQLNKFREALISGEIDPRKIENIGSEKRRALFEKFVDPENAINIDSLYESKLLLKNRERGYITWAKRAIGMNPQVRRDLASKIERLNELGVLDPKEFKAYKEDLVRTRLGVNISFKEAKTINQLSEERTRTKEVWDAELKEHPEWSEDPLTTRKQWIGNSSRIQYGLRERALENYVNDLKLETKRQRVSFKEDPIRAIVNPILEAPEFFNGLFKSVASSIDDSFFGRQGVKNLYGTPAQKRIWTRNFVKSFSDISAELRRKKIDGFDPMDFIKADIYSRPNAVNGKYKAGGYQLDVLSEEIFPTSLPEKVPGLGRLFKASETAFSGGALRMRADLADMFISKMDKQGINSLDPKQARGAGHLVGSLTGRGSLGKGEVFARQLNLLLWSAKFFKSNVETVIAPFTYLASKAGIIDKGNKGTQFARAEAAKNMVSIVGHVAGIMMLAKFLDPESVDEDPRSTNFGRVKIFGHWTDVTGGMRAIAIMAARLVPTSKDGEWGIWRKSSAGNWTDLTAGKFGKDDAVDVFMDALLLNRLAPISSIVRDYYKGSMFGGAPFNLGKSIINSAVPFSIQSVIDVKDEAFEAILGVAISEFVGFGVSTYKYQDNWERKTSIEMKQFKEQVGEQKFKDANESYNRAYNVWFDEVQKDQKYKDLSDEGKSKLRGDAKSAIKTKILNEYGYNKFKEPKTLEELKEKEVIKGLKPLRSLLNKAVEVIAKIKLSPQAMASEGERGVTAEKQKRFDEIEQRIDDIVEVINKRKKSKLLSPQGIKGMTDEVNRLIAEGEKLLTAPSEKGADTGFGRNPEFKKTKPKENVDTAIRKASDEFDVPSELLFDIALQESSLIADNVNTTPEGKEAGNPTGLFQFTDETWKNVIRFNSRKGSALYKKLKNTDRNDPETNAMAAAFLIHFGQLGKWDASENIWGEFWTTEELEKMGFYKQTIHHKKGVRPSVRLASG